MAYISANEVKAIREELKAKFPNLKFGCRKGTGSYSVDVTIKQGDIDFSDILKDSRYAQINHHWLGNYGDHSKMFEEILEVIKTAPAKAPGGEAWFDESDSMIDYFHTAFYIHLNVGEWNKPYALVK